MKLGCERGFYGGGSVLLRYLVGQSIKDVQVTGMSQSGGVEVVDDKVTINLFFADGSFGTVHYLANGHKSFPKERVEVFCGGVSSLWTTSGCSGGTAGRDFGR